MSIVIAIHVVVCIGLIIVVLIQSGRGGGLVESFSGIESVFGTKTNAFLTRTTGILATLFILTCLTLAFLSLKQSRSLMGRVAAESRHAQVAVPTNTSAPAAEANALVNEKTRPDAGSQVTQENTARTHTTSSQEQEPIQKE
ncbi:MAG: preprotein translocase subunit SecG [Candidatus Omnitrophota bacterium]|nr:MAG: preprotein translocase subunit SecG [Candidatus Omnitrophota bacterium]